MLSSAEIIVSFAELNAIAVMKLEKTVVIGGSIAGLLAARVLAEYCDSVTIIERDKLPLQPHNRKGVPQSVQPHVLLVRGYRILEELFPGIGSQLSAAGALTIDWLREFYLFAQGQWSNNAVAPSEIISFTCSRPLLEWTIRKRLAEFSQIKFIEQHRAIALLTNSHKTQVTGIKLQSLTGDGIKDLAASLVVDASGRSSHAPQWLEDIGLTPPPETIVNPFLGYATRRYKPPEDFTAGWKVMLISQEAPQNTRLGYLAKIEGGELIATLGGYGRDFPPLDEQGFLAFARSLSSSCFYEIIKDAEPVSPIYAHRATANRLRHYEQVQMPKGFVALGDAVCALCPVYGQGMTVSALSAMVLKDWLNNSQLVTSRFQKNLAKSNALHWILATGQDSRFPTTAGRKQPNRLNKLLAGYNQKLMQMSNVDTDLRTLFAEVSHFLKSPLTFYHPQVILRVIRSSKQKIKESKNL
ncbi:monooxygenase [Fischerella thermalis CCMEE 5330]|uniref:Monooxygenase n=1 Tax=Fischerella thermalis CCMEE 5330 TaxID=2019670 RepID=A0A2N6M7D1_9CYAN|nr:monooxygenase [Fischerella thermalis]PMB42650.1 monooxygenase [Fischerella thermalis CCMEE 5330]